MRQNLTTNMVDISITILSLNITKEEHFCFKYFNYHNGSPHTLVPHILKKAVGIVASRKNHCCQNCDHAEDEDVDIDLKLMIPQWFMDANYPERCLVPCVSTAIVLL